MFGLWNEAPTAGPAWGARAIFSNGSVDLLWDRQTCRDVDDAFVARVNSALPVAREKARELRFSSLAGDVSEVVTLAEMEGIVIKGSTNASFGYLYLIAYDQVPCLSEAPEGLTWSGETEPPAVGETVKCHLGKGLVTGYFVEAGFLGVKVRLDNPPKWFVRQNGRLCPACLFGAEITGRTQLDKDVAAISAFEDFGDLEHNIREHGYTPTVRCHSDDSGERREAVDRVRQALADRKLPFFPATLD
jgi:hypothetical protein